MVDPQKNSYIIATDITIPTRAAPINSMNDIKRFDEEVWRVTKGLPIRTGSILRVPGRYYDRWGIQVTSENYKEIVAAHDYFRRKDYKEAEARGSVERTIFSRGIRDRMRRIIVQMAKQILKLIDDGEREISICDLAASKGKTVSALATDLWNDNETKGILQRTSFYLVDYSGTRLEEAKGTLEPFKPRKIDTRMCKDEVFLDGTENKFDIVLSLCHLHKKPFLTEVLKGVHKVLGDDGVFLSGDWHSSLCNHPSFIYDLLKMMPIDRKRLQMFEMLFTELLDRDSEPGTTMPEFMGREAHQRYWFERHKQIYNSGVVGRERRHYILGAFDTTKERVNALEKAGLTVDIDEIRRAFPKAKLASTPMAMVHGPDRASVVMAMKRRPKG